MRAGAPSRPSDAGVRASRYFTELALLPAGWSRNVRIDVDGDGFIAAIASEASGGDATRLSGALVPGMPNAHSHAFQRAAAGRFERTGTRETFWTWREGMYALAGRLDPDDLESIASYLYAEMLEAGYTSVAEFHYLHNAPGGTPYANRSETSERILQAARRAGIGLTLLLVLYRHPDFGDEPVLPEQRRFVLGVDELAAMYATLQSQTQRDPAVRIGVAPHSLRAVTADELRALLAAVSNDTPVHIHVAEQQREVADCERYYEARPVAWLLAHAPLSARWALVHATHATPEEIRGVAASGATIVLCPTTEADLGDGIFPADVFAAANGTMAIGSDSHVAVDPAAELRLVEYAQRLQHQRRGVLGSLYGRAAAGGAQALGIAAGKLEVGQRADFLSLDLAHPSLAGCAPEELLDAWVFGTARNLVRDVVAGGRHVVTNGRHRERDAVARDYVKTLQRLR